MLDARIEHAGGAFAVPQLRIPPGANLEFFGRSARVKRQQLKIAMPCGMPGRTSTSMQKQRRLTNHFWLLPP